MSKHTPKVPAVVFTDETGLKWDFDDKSAHGEVVLTYTLDMPNGVYGEIELCVEQNPDGENDSYWRWLANLDGQVLQGSAQLFHDARKELLDARETLEHEADEEDENDDEE